MPAVTTQSGQGDVLLTAKEVGKELRVPIGTLGQWRHRRIGPPWFKLENGHVRYRQSKFAAWLESQEQKTEEETSAA